jgi:hypothetical protein
VLLTELFGASATFDETAKTVSFDLDELTTITDTSVILTVNVDEWADRIAAALLLHWKAANTANTDPTDGIYVGDPYKSFETRGDQAQISFNYNVAVYIPDTVSDLDPDLVA